MNQIILFVLLFSIIAVVGIIFRKTPIPISLLLVISGMFISYIPEFPRIGIAPQLVLDVFLPLLIYEATLHISWVDIRKNFQPISLHSIGHVIFITLLVAVAIHTLIPTLGWPLSFVLGAVVAPPDDVAIISIAEKVRMPRKIMTVLLGEAMLNDATALILFRFSLAALITHEFFPFQAFSTFCIVIATETVYGLLLGHLLGQIRLRVNEPILQAILSLLTPFLAYLPTSYLGGSGVIATVVTGLLISHVYSERFPPEVRLTSRAVWTTLGFLVQSMLFLLVGLDLRAILSRISIIPFHTLALYCSAIIGVVIVGRFLWVYPATYLPRFFFSTKKRDSSIPWQYPFVISWSGMRGGISLAAAVAIPKLPTTLDGVSPRDLIIFLVFCVIIATLILQGLALPWILEVLGIKSRGETEKSRERFAELSARLMISDTILHWLADYREINIGNDHMHEEIDFHIQEYKTLNRKLQKQIKNHGIVDEHSKSASLISSIMLASRIIEVERIKVLELWNQGKITHGIKNKLIRQLDLRDKHIAEFSG